MMCGQSSVVQPCRCPSRGAGLFDKPPPVLCQIAQWPLHPVSPVLCTGPAPAFSSPWRWCEGCPGFYVFPSTWRWLWQGWRRDTQAHTVHPRPQVFICWGVLHVCCVSNFVGAFRSPAGCMMGITDWKSKSGRHKFERSSQAAFLMQNPQHQRTGAEVVLHKLHLSLSLSTGGKWISASSVLVWESCRYFLEIQCLRPLG